MDVGGVDRAWSVCLARARGRAGARSARWPSPPTSGRRSPSPSWRPSWRSRRACRPGGSALRLRGRPRRSGVHRLEQRLARRRPRPGRRRGPTSRSSRGRCSPRDCCARRPSWPPSLAVVLSLLLGLVPGPAAAGPGGQRLGLQRRPEAHRGVRGALRDRVRRAARRRRGRGARARRSRRGGWSPRAARWARPRTWPTSPPTSRTTWRPASAGCRTGSARGVSAVVGALLLGGASVAAGRSARTARRRRRAGSALALAVPAVVVAALAGHAAVPPAGLPGRPAADRAGRRAAAARRGRGHLTAAPAGSVAGRARCRCRRCRCRCRCRRRCRGPCRCRLPLPRSLGDVVARVSTSAVSVGVDRRWSSSVRSSTVDAARSARSCSSHALVVGPAADHGAERTQPWRAAS